MEYDLTGDLLPEPNQTLQLTGPALRSRAATSTKPARHLNWVVRLQNRMGNQTRLVSTFFEQMLVKHHSTRSAGRQLQWKIA
jgi:hypothetical protein